jgi:hypothetical protein
LIGSDKPAFSALINGITTFVGTTLLNFMPISVKIPTLTPAASAEIHKPIGINLKNVNKKTAIRPKTTK